tara:strand:+ start:1084 stop:1242 length:159 start_codon:yes stop_codon:yes gene_type:complete
MKNEANHYAEQIGTFKIGPTIYRVFSEFDKRPLPPQKENPNKRKGEKLPWAK